MGQAQYRRLGREQVGIKARFLLRSEGEVRMFKKFTDSVREFFSDVRGELKKVSFTTRAETIGSTTVVIVFCIIMSIYLSVVDSFLVWVVSKIL